ncbi:hypothetical protein PLESTB_000120000 [Pleodorina starrii]|uniref:Uncharacterized protein n=1 Tax=Pleodorina starrii TaxID=330485 RepID=A0A9W6BBB5_9CHLO|nr:hypothetical protein PLESTM_000978600 [Pleodorina starrii]GLC48635.1 hypothetical protein PLESTB_000120000 [Pleodorina starrii]GLC76357.1 hypothetical protein PLESTF_001770800 [Pleodorina starrii]
MTLRLSRSVLRNIGCLYTTLPTQSPEARQIVIDLSPARGGQLDDMNSDQNMALDEEEDDAALVDGALDALAALRHPLTSLTILHLSRPLPLPSAATLDYLASCGLSELQLQDVSIQRSASDGASNLLRSHSPPSPSLPGQLLGSSLADSIRARGAAMVRFACCLPTLQRLSLCNAAFSSGDVAALATLTQLQELSLDGAMECSPCSQLAAIPPQPHLIDAAAIAALVYKTILSSLPRLQRLQLPMAIAVSHLCSGRTSGDGWDSDADEENAADAEDNDEADCGSWMSLTPAGFMSETNSGFYTESTARTISGGGGFIASTTAAAAPPIPTDMELAGFINISLKDISAPSCRGGAGYLHDSVGYFSEYLQESPGLMRRRGGPTHMDPRAAVPASPPRAPWSVGAGCSPQTETSARWYESAAGGWVFPPLLEELTIPLCSLNGPVFRAACEAYGRRHCGAVECEHERAERGSAPVRGLRALHITCAPGYTVWAGSFLKADRDFAALSLLGTSLECLHLSLELGGSGRGALRRDRLRTCLRHLRPLARLKDLRITETRPPLTFSTRKTNGALGTSSPPDLLMELLGGCAGWPCISRGSSYGGRDQAPASRVLPRSGSCSDVRLPTLPHLGAPRTLDSRSPSSLSASPSPPLGAWGGGVSPIPCAPASAAAATSGSAPPWPLPFSSWPPSLDCLLVPWPHLETLVVCGQRAVRNGRGGHTRLVLLESLEQMMEIQGRTGGKA